MEKYSKHVDTMRMFYFWNDFDMDAMHLWIVWNGVVSLSSWETMAMIGSLNQNRRPLLPPCSCFGMTPQIHRLPYHPVPSFFLPDGVYS